MQIQDLFYHVAVRCHSAAKRNLYYNVLRTILKHRRTWMLENDVSELTHHCDAIVARLVETLPSLEEEHLRAVIQDLASYHQSSQDGHPDSWEIWQEDEGDEVEDEEEEDEEEEEEEDEEEEDEEEEDEEEEEEWDEWVAEEEEGTYDVLDGSVIAQTIRDQCRFNTLLTGMSLLALTVSTLFQVISYNHMTQGLDGNTCPSPLNLQFWRR